MAEGFIPEGIDEEIAESSRVSLDLATTRALHEAEQDPATRTVAAEFLASHKRFVDLQAAFFSKERHNAHRAAELKHVSDILRIVAQAAFIIAGLAVVSGIVAMWWSAVTSRAVIIDSFEAPSALAADGIVGTVIAGQVLDELLQMQDATRVIAARREISGAWGDSVEITVPEAGISLGQINRGLHRIFGHDIHIDGALIRTADGSLSLTVRGDDIAPARFEGGAHDLDDLTQRAAEYIFGRAQPLLYANYLISVGRFEDCIKFARGAFPHIGDDSRPALANLWGEALLALNRPSEAESRLRLALQIAPHYWRAWNSLVAALPLTAGEEAAYQSGRAMLRAGDSLPSGSRPTLYDQTSFAQLTLDPGAVIAGLTTDRRLAEREGAEFDDSSWIAEQEAVRHDWGSVAQYLAQSPQADPTTAFDLQFLGGLQAMETGNSDRAIPMLEAADKLWHATPLLQSYFADFGCYLGHAYVDTGRVTDGLAYLRDPHFVRCRAYYADALDRSGDWPAAQRAYHDAEAVAPSLAFAYYREGLALLRHNDATAAMSRLEVANRLSPHWADPLKAMGDILASQHHWRDALRRYEQALQWAPTWVDLKTACDAAASEQAKSWG